MVVRAELGTMTESFGLLMRPEVAAILSTGVAALRCASWERGQGGWTMKLAAAHPHACVHALSRPASAPCAMGARLTTTAVTAGPIMHPF